MCKDAKAWVRGIFVCDLTTQISFQATAPPMSKGPWTWSQSMSRPRGAEAAGVRSVVRAEMPAPPSRSSRCDASSSAGCLSNHDAVARAPFIYVLFLFLTRGAP